MVFRQNLSNSKSTEISRTPLSILDNLNYAEVWIISTCPFISKSFRPFTNPLEIIPSAPNTIGITVTIVFKSFLFLWQNVGTYSSFWSFKILPRGLAMTAKFTIQKIPFVFVFFFFFFLFFFTITWSGHLPEVK